MEGQSGQSGIPENITIIHKTYGAFTLPEMQLQVLTVNNTHVVFTTSGMEGEYYNGTNFEEKVLTRIDPIINFNWYQRT